MVNEDLDAIAENESSYSEDFSDKQSNCDADARRRIEAKLDEARLNKLLNGYDYELD